MKAEIITIISNNYGNRLQNYALQEVLKKIGFEVTTNAIVRHPILHRIKKGFMAKRAKTTEDNFAVFDKNIKWRFVKKGKNLENSKIKYFIAGSDQIWNPEFQYNSDREFLIFTTCEKKIAYAASIGLDELPQNEIDKYRRYISAFKTVSVREQSAADIIEGLGCTRPKVVLDPTMLLAEDQWKVVINQSKLKIEQRYVVAYFLGIRTAEFDSYIVQKAKEMNAELIDIMNLASDVKKKIGPAEFVSLLYHSESVFTDSFHGTVFSILFHKPFVVFERPYEDGYGKMSSRLDTLLETFSLNEYRVNRKEQLRTLALKYDFSRVDEILQEKRKDSIEFLKKVLND